ncbi:MAG: Zn-ribbon domain-containing OB-fold protein [Myxococcota bacterium]|nr:Zn-ribbon domain-containing OB-fold protein [Myxococcota bacterium]
MGKPRVPAVEGWFTLDEAEPRLLGARCPRCRTVFFPRESFCRNPHCASRPDADAAELEEVPLSNRGRLWSYTSNHYAPPPPFVAKDPFAPFAVAAVELEDERMVVLGQVPEDVPLDRLEVGMEMRLVLDTLHEDDERTVLVWKWRPVAGEAR